MNDKLLLMTAAVCCIIIIGDEKKKRIWAKEWLRRRDERGRGCLNLLHRELRVEDKPSFVNFLRMNEETFTILLNKTQHLYTYRDTNMRQCISTRDILSATLRFLATGETITSLSYSLRIGKSTLSKIITEVVDAIYITLKKEYLKVPCTKEEWLQIAREFEEKWNFPNCIGAIDGKHITFRPLKEEGSFYRNYKGTDSIVLLAVVDANYKFLMVDVDINGRISDGGVFHRSAILCAILKNTLNIPEDKSLSNYDEAVAVPYVLVGDDAFPLSNRLMKPFKYHGLEYEQKNYNYRVSRARRVVENAFGILANKFRVFLSPMNLNVQKVENITLACCALHNFLLQRHVIVEDTLEEKENVLTSVNWKHGRKSGYEAMVVHETFVDYFNSVGKVSWQDAHIETI